MTYTNIKSIGLAIGLVGIILFIVLSNQWIMREVENTGTTKALNFPSQEQTQSVLKGKKISSDPIASFAQSDVSKNQKKRSVQQEKTDRTTEDVVYEPPMEGVILVQ